VRTVADLPVTLTVGLVVLTALVSFGDLPAVEHGVGRAQAGSDDGNLLIWRSRETGGRRRLRRVVKRECKVWRGHSHG